MLRTDILMDLGRPINEGIDYGQVCGAFVQGMGWASTENLYYNDQGKLMSHSPTTYKIPNIQDMPRNSSYRFYFMMETQSMFDRSKAVGEPPLVLGLMFGKQEDALNYAGANTKNFELPASNEENLKTLKGTIWV